MTLRKKNAFSASIAAILLSTYLTGCAPREHREGILLEEFLYEQADFPSCHFGNPC